MPHNLIADWSEQRHPNASTLILQYRGSLRWIGQTNRSWCCLVRFRGLLDARIRPQNTLYGAFHTFILVKFPLLDATEEDTSIFEMIAYLGVTGSLELRIMENFETSTST